MNARQNNKLLEDLYTSINNGKMTGHFEQLLLNIEAAALAQKYYNTRGQNENG